MPTWLQKIQSCFGKDAFLAPSSTTAHVFEYWKACSPGNAAGLHPPCLGMRCQTMMRDPMTNIAGGAAGARALVTMRDPMTNMKRERVATRCSFTPPLPPFHL